VNTKPKRRRGRPHGTTKDPKVPITVMLLEATKARLDRAVDQTGLTRSEFVDRTLQEKFRKDGIS
jgi:hypothetical protein